jgi:hypothetical protein
VTDTSVVDLDADFVCARRKHLDILDAEGLASLPGDGSFAGDGLCVFS